MSGQDISLVLDQKADVITKALNWYGCGQTLWSGVLLRSKQVLLTEFDFILFTLLPKTYSRLQFVQSVCKGHANETSVTGTNDPCTDLPD